MPFDFGDVVPVPFLFTSQRASKKRPAVVASNRGYSTAPMGPDNVRVNCVAPGLVKTEFARVLYEDPQRRAAREAATPRRRLGEPEDIAGVALMLASRAGAFITGRTIIVDGGTTIAP